MQKYHQDDAVILNFNYNDLKRMIKALRLLKEVLVSENAENNGNLSLNEDYTECIKMINNLRCYWFEMLVDQTLTDTNEETN